jgi:hypothetical protein
MSVQDKLTVRGVIQGTLGMILLVVNLFTGLQYPLLVGALAALVLVNTLQLAFCAETFLEGAFWTVLLFVFEIGLVLGYQMFRGG